MSSQPNIAPQIVSFVAPRRSYVLHNAKPKRVEVMYVGNLMTLPAIDEVHAIKADTDADGDPIPGTYVLEDQYIFIPDIGDEVLIFDCAKAIAHILGLKRGSDGKLTEATGHFAVGGVSLLPRHSTKEQWQGVAATGEQRAWMTRVRVAQQLIQDVDEKNARRKSAGMDAVHGGPEWDAARALITEYNAVMQQDARKVLSISPVASEKLDDDIEITAIARAKAMELATTVSEGKKIDAQQLFNELMDDPKIRQWAQKEWRFRRRGHEPIKDAELVAAAELGVPVSAVGLEK
jgi:hypothetical protein